MGTEERPRYEVEVMSYPGTWTHYMDTSQCYLVLNFLSDNRNTFYPMRVTDRKNNSTMLFFDENIPEEVKTSEGK